MTTLARLAIAVLLSLFASSCMMDVNFGNGKTGNGEIVEESRDVKEDFDVVSASEGIDVFVTQGSEFNITVEADENIIDLIGNRYQRWTITNPCHRKYWQGHQKRLRNLTGNHGFGEFQWSRPYRTKCS